LSMPRMGIRVNTVALGVIKTPMHKPETYESLKGLHPMGRMGEIKEVVDAVLFLTDATFTTGEILHVMAACMRGNGSPGSSRPTSAERRLQELGIQLPTPPEPFGIYAEAVQTGNLLFLTGMLPTVGREAKFIGRSVRNSIWKQARRRLGWRRSMPSLSRGSIWDRSTK